MVQSHSSSIGNRHCKPSPTPFASPIWSSLLLLEKVSEMYDIVPWLDFNTFLAFAIAIVGYVVVSWLLTVRVQLQATDGCAISKDVLYTKTLASELKAVTADWYQLGLNLGLETSELKKIRRDIQGSDQQMLETLDLWLRRVPNASWMNLVDALQQMGENRVAEDIRQKYIEGGGKLIQGV